MIEQIKIYASLSMLIVFSIWFVFSIDPEGTPVPVVSSTSPDYYMEGFLATAYDEHGAIKQRLGAQRMAHFPTGNRSELKGVLIAANTESQGKWEIRAGHGVAKSGSDIIELSENIEIHQTDPQYGLAIQTAALTINVANDEAYTDHPVKIHSNSGKIDSIGMHIDLAKRAVKLTSQVRGQFHAQ